MRPIDGSGQRLPSRTPSQHPAKKSASGSKGQGAGDPPALPPKPPGRTGVTLYVGPSAPNAVNALQAAWQEVEETLFDVPRQSLAGLKRDYVASHLARMDVTRAVQRVAPKLEQAVRRLSPAETDRWPSFGHHADAVRLVHAFMHVYAPDPEYLGNADYEGMRRHGQVLTDAFTRLGRTLSREDDTSARPCIKQVTQRWAAYRHHLQRWQQSFLPATWKFPEQRLELTELQVHAMLMDPEARIINTQNLSALYTGLLTALCFPPRETALAFQVLKDMREHLIDMSPQDKTYLGEAFDVEDFERRDELGALDNATLFRACAFVGAALPKNIPNNCDYASYETQDYPLHLLPQAILGTYQATLLAYNVSRHFRLRDVLPSIAEKGIAWERENFARVLRNAQGKMPHTEDWLRTGWQRTPPGSSLQLRHAHAVSALLLADGQWQANVLPETLALASANLEKISKQLHDLMRVVLAGQHLEKICKYYGVDCNASDVRALQKKILESQDDRACTPIVLANSVIDEAVEILALRRWTPMKSLNGQGLEMVRLGVERADVADACLREMLHEVTDLQGERPEAVRRKLTADFAQALVKPTMHDATGFDTALWQQRLEALARSATLLTRVDLQVHGDYYAHLLESANTATSGDTPDAPL